MEEGEKWILLMTHGQLCEAIIESAAVIAGQLEDVYPLPLMPGTPPESYMAQAEATLQKAPAGSYILTDIYGGTPCNVARMLLRKYDVQVFSGLSLAMILELDNLRREEMSPQELAVELLKLTSKSQKYLNDCL